MHAAGELSPDGELGMNIDSQTELAISELFLALATVSLVVTTIVLHRRDVRRKDREDERKQAEKISGWLIDDQPAPTEPTTVLYLSLVMNNASDELIYNLVASIVTAQSGTRIGDSRIDFRTFVGRLPPGRWQYRIPYGGHGMSKRFSVELAFEDSAGRSWLRTGKGKLEKKSKPPLELYGIDPPVSWEMP